jgi:hypothetical protein
MALGHLPAAADELKANFAAVWPAPMLDKINALPHAERQLAADDRYVQRYAIEHCFDVGGHVIRAFHIMDPWRIFRRQTIKRSNQIRLHVGIGIFLDREGCRGVAEIDK